MSHKDYSFPIKEIRQSFKRYAQAKQNLKIYQKHLSDEAALLFPHFIQYARKLRTEERHDFTELIKNFYSDILELACDSKDSMVRSSLTKRFNVLMKKYIIDTSNDQVRLDEYLHKL